MHKDVIPAVFSTAQVSSFDIKGTNKTWSTVDLTWEAHTCFYVQGKILLVMVRLTADFLIAYYVLDFSSCLYTLTKHHITPIACWLEKKKISPSHKVARSVF